MTDVSVEVKPQETQLKTAAEQGLLIDDAILLFRRIVDRMPTATWLLEARRLVEMEPGSEGEARRKADTVEELEDLRADLRLFALDWVLGWYAKDGVYVSEGGALESIRSYAAGFAPELAGVSGIESGLAISPETLEQVRPVLLPHAPEIVIGVMTSTHLVVSDAMKYALLGRV